MEDKDCDEKAIKTLVKEHLTSVEPEEREVETLRMALVTLRIHIEKAEIQKVIKKARQLTAGIHIKRWKDLSIT